MATTFTGWADSWGNSWGSVATDPNAMRGSAAFAIAASLQVSGGEMQGSASFAFEAALKLVDRPIEISSGGRSIGAPWQYIPFTPVKARRPRRVRDEELAIF